MWFSAPCGSRKSHSSRLVQRAGCGEGRPSGCLADPLFLLPFWTGQRWKKPGVFYKTASLRLIRPRAENGFSVVPNWPQELTNPAVRRNGGFDVHPMAGLRGLKLSCTGRREKPGSLPSMLAFGQQ